MDVKKPMLTVLGCVYLGIFTYFCLFQVYPWVLVIPVFGFTVVTGILAIRQSISHIPSEMLSREILVFFCLFLASFLLRMYRLEEITPGMWGDEVTYGILSEKLVSSRTFMPYTSDPFAPSTPFLYLIGFSTSLLGKSMSALRIPSIIFSSLSVSVFYVLLRQYLPMLPSALGAILFLFSYSFMVISRFDYEMTAGIFFQLCTLVFLFRFLRKRNPMYLVGAALSVAGGMYMYLAFRLQSFFLTSLVALTVFSGRSQSLKTRITQMFIFMAVLFIATIPIISFAIRNPEHVSGRVKAVSVFHQGLPAAEITNELKGNIRRTFGMFTGIGDPNPNHNPADVMPFDYGIEILAIAGILLMFITKKRHLAFFLLIMTIPSFLNDILTIELFPEFHYYGTGHPMVTRLSGLIPIMYIFAAFGLVACIRLFGTMNFGVTAFRRLPIPTVIVIVLTFLIAHHNYGLYFYQTPNRWIYEANHLRVHNAISMISDYSLRDIAVSKIYYEDERFSYFVPDSVRPHILNLDAEETSISALPHGVTSIISVREHIPLAQTILTSAPNPDIVYRAAFNQWKEVETLYVQRLK